MAIQQIDMVLGILVRTYPMEGRGEGIFRYNSDGEVRMRPTFSPKKKSNVPKQVQLFFFEARVRGALSLMLLRADNY